MTFPLIGKYLNNVQVEAYTVEGKTYFLTQGKHPLKSAFDIFEKCTSGS